MCQSDPVAGEDKHGSVQFRLPGSPFTVQSGKESATIGKVFAIRSVRFVDVQCGAHESSYSSEVWNDFVTRDIHFVCRIFEEMNHLGYDLITSSDLSRAFDQSTWFFK